MIYKILILNYLNFNIIIEIKNWEEMREKENGENSRYINSFIEKI